MNAAIAWLVLGLLPLAVIFFVGGYLFALPLLREERSRFFLDLLEDGFNSGRTVEQTIQALATSRDTSLGLRFHLLAAGLSAGQRFGEAIEKVPGFLLPQVVAMLRVGESIGDVRRVVPACRGLLRDALSQSPAAYNYLFALIFVLVPIVPALSLMLSIFVLPKLEQVFADLSEGAQPTILSPYFIEWQRTFGEVQLILAAIFAVGTLVYLGGPRFVAWVEAGFFVRFFDRLFYWLPWRRKRMQRDFSRLLSLTLDAGVPETQAVQLAARGTNNVIFMNQASQVIRRLEAGEKLSDCLGSFGESSEFQWRLANAFHEPKNFTSALRGWFESLDAQAYQQEQAVSQVITSMVVVINGINVAFLIILIMGTLADLLQVAVLW